jgi:hypothetical protein
MWRWGLIAFVLGGCSFDAEQAQKAEDLAKQGLSQAHRGINHGAEKAKDKLEQARRDYGPAAKREWERAQEAAEKAWDSVEAQREASKEAQKNGKPLPDKWWTKASASIECNEDESTCRIEQWFVRACQANPFQVKEGLQLTPVYDPEHPEKGNTGVEVRSIPAGSVIAELGFEDGDEIQTVNGLRVADPMIQLELYTQLNERRTFEVVFARDGETVHRTIEVVDKL